MSGVLDALARQQLFTREGTLLIPPSRSSEELQYLTQIGNLALESLQRMYVVICIASQGTWNRQELLHHSASVARKLSRLFGLNGAEFSEQALFDQFVDGLIGEHWLLENAQGGLTPANNLHGVADAVARQILEPRCVWPCTG